MVNIVKREKPYWIRGNRENPDGVILALFREFPEEFIGENELSGILFNRSSGFRMNAANEYCIFYYDESRKCDCIRLLDESDAMEQEWLTTSSEWKELKPLFILDDDGNVLLNQDI